MSRKIQFSVESDEQKKELDEYAKSKGYGSAAALAKVALFQYVARYPAKESRSKPSEKDK